MITTVGYVRLLALCVGSAVSLGCGSNGTGPSGMSDRTPVLYIESNNPNPGQNSILAYRRASDGTLTPMAGSPFLTGGTGATNPTRAKLGPNDLDAPIWFNADSTRIFAVNSGSNTIAVFNVAENGSLTAVAGSPFGSGGKNPVSVGIAGNRLYVVNKNEDPLQGLDGLPNYTGFDIAANGALTPIPGSTVTTINGGSPTHALISRDKRLVFGADFFAPAKQPGIGSLRSFRIADNGQLVQAPGSPLALPGDPMTALPLGLWLHPSENILYVGFVVRAQIGVYNYDPASGALTFVTAVANSGKEICWIRATRSGTRLYTVNNIDNSVSFYDSSNPRAPVEMQKLTLTDPGPMFLNDRGPMSFMQVTSTPFQPSLDPEERYLYVLNQRADAQSPDMKGNKLHILRIGSDGRLSEPGPSMDLPVPVNARPQGLLIR